MQQSVTTGARGLRSRSKRPRSRIAALTRRSSQKTDWDKGRWAHLLIDPFLARVSSEGDSGMVLRGVFLRPPRRGVPTPDPDPNGEFEGACPLMRAPPRACQAPYRYGARSDPKSRSRQGRSPRSSRMAAECPAGRRRSGYYVHVIPTSPIALLSGK